MNDLILKDNKKPFLAKLEYEILLREFLATKKPSTAKSYAVALNRFTKNYGQFSFMTIALWHQETQNNKKFSNAYIRTNYSMIKSFFNFLVDIGTLSTNPIKLFKCQGSDHSTKSHRPLRQETLADIMDNHKNISRYNPALDLIRFQLLTGCRVSEVLELKHFTFSRDTRTLTIHGKGNRRRKLKLNLETLKSYRRILIRCKEYLVQDDSDELHCHARYRKYQRAVKRIIKKRGYKDFSTHSLRATYASYAYENGISIEKISQALGHTSINMTKTYIDQLRKHNSVQLPTSAELYSKPLDIVAS